MGRKWINEPFIMYHTKTSFENANIFCCCKNSILTWFKSLLNKRQTCVWDAFCGYWRTLSFTEKYSTGFWTTLLFFCPHTNTSFYDMYLRRCNSGRLSNIQEEIEELVKPHTWNPLQQKLLGWFLWLYQLKLFNSILYFTSNRPTMPNEFFERKIQNFAAASNPWMGEWWKLCSLQVGMHLIWIIKNFEYSDIILSSKEKALNPAFLLFIFVARPIEEEGS